MGRANTVGSEGATANPLLGTSTAPMHHKQRCTPTTRGTGGGSSAAASETMGRRTKPPKQAQTRAAGGTKVAP
jgi:hypothetical protein